MNDNDIQGIYNYCDRWCERCVFTSRCLVYKFSNEMEKNIDDKIKLNQVFWKFFDRNLDNTIEFIEESESEDEDVFLDSEEYTGDDFEIKRIIAESKEASQLAKEYLNVTSEWLKKSTGFLDDQELNTKLDNSIEVIKWYHFFIYPKIMRALNMKEDDLLETEYPKDSDGSAKVVLIAIERSISAWGYLFMQIDDKNETIFNIIKLLVTLQHTIEEEFPEARNFVRPGFDDENVN